MNYYLEKKEDRYFLKSSKNIENHILLKRKNLPKRLEKRLKSEKDIELFFVELTETKESHENIIYIDDEIFSYEN